MRIKFLMYNIMSFLLMLGLSFPVSADLDATGDADLAGYDILHASVKVYPSDKTDSIPDYITFCLDMNDGSSIPGMIIAEFDVDNNAGTGGNLGMTGIFKSCEGGDKIKPATAGFDVMIMLMLRDQDNDAGTAWCDGCYGPGDGQCFIKDTPCDVSCGGTGDCYKAVTSCDCFEGNPDCYLAQDPCQDVLPLCESCYEMPTQCICTEPCNIARKRGEWYAETAVGIGGGAPAYSGRIDMPWPQPADSSDPNKDCYTFPWEKIVNAVHTKSGGAFVLSAANDAANLKWQLSAWYDDDHTPPNDFFDETATPNCSEVVDVIPNSGKLSAVSGEKTITKLCLTFADQASCEDAGCYWKADKSWCTACYCQMDGNKEGKVTGGALGTLKKEYGRLDCPGE